ncbi:ABC transporter ATP-binding protein [Tissierella sp.]|uniref:ABC transporter ATP-binding protein n=1 Tax=Tissierella sp. TaxID=41274 RepID=UPI00286140F2|nr:ABC transporter ATP-binding protein [Tissierella sp.]MDR7855082.1 ABC transporter ATP-binding protein [Tissierella sp.]
MQKSYKRFLPLILSYPKYQFLGLLFSLLASLFSSGSSYTLKILIDDVLIPKKLDMIWTIQFIFIGLVLLNGIFTILKTYFLYKSSTKTMVDIRKKLFSKSLQLSMDYHNTTPAGDIISIMVNDVNALSRTLFGSLAEFFSSVITIFVVLIWLLYLDFRLTIITIPIFPILILVFKTLNKYLERVSIKSRESNVSMINAITEMINGIKSIKIMNLDMEQNDISEKSFINVAKCTLKYELIFTLMNLSTWMLIMVPYQAILYGIGGTWYVKNGTPTIGLLMAFGNFTNMLIGPTLSLLNVFSNLTNADISLDKIEGFYREPSEQLGRNAIEDIRDPNIEFKNVTFTYNNKEEPILKDISFNLESGKIIGLTGRSGSGKTTILNILTAFYMPDKGSILINNQSLYDVLLSEWRNEISYLTQDSFIFSNTLRYNLSLFDKNISEKQLLDVINQVDLLSWFKSLPNGLDTYLGEKGANISIGQKQKLGIAQAILKKCSILILDEPTSALDFISEKSIMNILNNIKEEKIILVVSHRDETLQKMDEVIILEDGNIMKIGKWVDIKEFY